MARREDDVLSWLKLVLARMEPELIPLSPRETGPDIIDVDGLDEEISSQIKFADRRRGQTKTHTRETVRDNQLDRTAVLVSEAASARRLWTDVKGGVAMQHKLFCSKSKQ